MLSRVQLFATPGTATRQASLSITSSRSLLRLISLESVMPSNHLIFCHPLFLLPSIFPSIRVFSSESVLPIRWPKYWSFSFSYQSFQWYSGLISFSMDWLDLLAVQGTLKHLLQHHSSIWAVVFLYEGRKSHMCVFQPMEKNSQKRTYIYIYIKPNHLAVHLKLTQYCKSILKNQIFYFSWKTADLATLTQISHGHSAGAEKPLYSPVILTVWFIFHSS